MNYLHTAESHVFAHMAIELEVVENDAGKQYWRVVRVRAVKSDAKISDPHGGVMDSFCEQWERKLVELATFDNSADAYEAFDAEIKRIRKGA